MRSPSVTPPRIVVVGGGTRSGKSALALELARKLGARRAFVATARAYDDEMRARIDRHRREREAAFETFEEPLDLPGALRRIAGPDVVVVDCVTHWLSNLLVDGVAPEAIVERVEEAVRALSERRFHAVLVTNEVGMSVHPETPLGRAFVEVTGFANQRLSRAADDVHLAILGTSLLLRGAGAP
jgi:adenosylcobinamide kinase/adenosylcobinamide-phosphate guanylyltransferase